ncbi:unnamed protein product, partial [Nesidiocoris tenuis]
KRIRGRRRRRRCRKAERPPPRIGPIRARGGRQGGGPCMVILHESMIFNLPYYRERPGGKFIFGGRKGPRSSSAHRYVP